MKKEDARVTKTKGRLFFAFRALLAEKTFEEITINEICIRAEVRRATFYKHFCDKYDFLAALTTELRKDFDRYILNSKKWKNRPPVDYYIEYLLHLSFLLPRDYTLKPLSKKERPTKCKPLR